MSPFRKLLIVCIGILPSLVALAWAQQNPPRLGYVFPAGGQRGTSFRVAVGGQFLAGAAKAYISGGGVLAEVVDYERPMVQQDLIQLRERLQELQKQAKNGSVQEEILGIRTRIASVQRKRANPALSDAVTLRISIEAGSEPGERELRLLTSNGLSNPIVFMIGELPEVLERLPVESLDAGTQKPRTEMEITLPATVNGRILPPLLGSPGVQAPAQGQPFTPGDTDRYRFRARQGQELVMVANARRLMPYLADTVPGWFQAVLALYDSNGKEIAYEDDYRFSPDPVLHHTILRDGEYVLEIKDSLYRGREDFVYRISMGEIPFVTHIFPLGGRAGENNTIEVQGWNLPGGEVNVNSEKDFSGIHKLVVHHGDLVSNAVPFMEDTLSQVFESEPNDLPGRAQPVLIPAMIDGRVNRPGDWDAYSFKGRAGQEIVVEVYARRLDSPLDSLIRLSDAGGQTLAFNDDHEDKAMGLVTHQADSLISARLPTDGIYCISLGDAQQKGGDEYGYRLRISSPHPDFDLRITPSSINAAAGMTVPVAVHVIRKDGFAGSVELALTSAPRGMTLSGALIPEGRDQMRMTLSVPPGLLVREPLTLGIEGRATIEGRRVIRRALPAEDRMQAFAYRHLVAAESLKIVAPRRIAVRTPELILETEVLRIPAGGSVRVRIRVPNTNTAESIDYELSEPPDGIALKTFSSIARGTDLVLECDASKAKPGEKGNLIVNVVLERTVTPPTGGTPAARRVQMGTLPAIPFEIVRGP